MLSGDEAATKPGAPLTALAVFKSARVVSLISGFPVIRRIWAAYGSRSRPSSCSDGRKRKIQGVFTLIAEAAFS